MISNSLLALTSVSQWALFIGIGVILFGLIEKNEKYILGGKLVFVALGLLAIWVLAFDGIYIPSSSENSVSKELRTLIYFKAVAVFSAMSVISVLLRFFKVPYARVLLYIVIIYALILFFIVFNIQQMSH